MLIIARVFARQPSNLIQLGEKIGRKNLPITSGEKQADCGQLAKKTDPRSHAMIVVDNDTLAHIRNELRETTEICNHAQCIAYPFE